MSWVTANGTDNDMAVEVAGAGGLAELTQDVMLRTAERLVKRYAKPPDPVTTDYTDAASDAELLIFLYLANTEGIVSSEGVGPINTSYVDFEKIKTIVSTAMADYKSTTEGSSDIAYVEEIYRR